MDNIISIKNLTVELAGFKLDKINLDIPEGVVVGFVGKNGSGKTTLINTLTDIYNPTEGEILYAGMPLVGNEAKVKEMIGVVYDSLIYPGNVKAIKMAQLIAPLFEMFDMDKWHQLMQRMNLPEKKRLSEYSKGMQMKFMLTIVLARNPRVLILDESTAGLDPEARREVLDLIQEYMEEEGHTVFFSTHITTDLDKIADYIVMIDKGQIVFMEEKDALLDRYAMVQVEKSSIAQPLRDNLIGVKENAFGYIGLTENREVWKDVPGVQLTRPSVEDIMIFRGGKEI